MLSFSLVCVSVREVVWACGGAGVHVSAYVHVHTLKIELCLLILCQEREVGKGDEKGKREESAFSHR